MACIYKGKGKVAHDKTQASARRGCKNSRKLLLSLRTTEIDGGIAGRGRENSIRVRKDVVRG